MMTLERTTAARETPSSTRDFDYGVGDDNHAAEVRLRADIAARIREASRLDATATLSERFVYERAAQIVEGLT